MIFKANTFLVLLLVGVSLFSCKKDDPSDTQPEIDEQIILEYLAENNIEAVKHESGLYYRILKEGSGIQPSTQSSVEVYYKGYLTNGTVFDQTTQGPVVFGLNGLIPGWQIGIPLLKKGGKGLFIVPSALGYGSQSTGQIPANSVLIFEIDLVDVF